MFPEVNLDVVSPYFYLTVAVLVGVFLYIVYDLFHTSAWHLYQNNVAEGFVANIKEEDKIRRVDLAEKVLDKVRKENKELDAYLQVGSFKDTYEEIIFEMNDLANKNMLGLVSNMSEMKGWKMYQMMQQVNELNKFKGALSSMLENISPTE